VTVPLSYSEKLPLSERQVGARFVAKAAEFPPVQIENFGIEGDGSNGRHERDHNTDPNMHVTSINNSVRGKTKR